MAISASEAWATPHLLTCIMCGWPRRRPVAHQGRGYSGIFIITDWSKPVTMPMLVDHWVRRHGRVL